MKNDFPIMPLRAMYADKSTEGKDLNKVGSIEPVVVPDGEFDLDTLIKAAEAGAFIFNGKTWFVTSFISRNGEHIDMYATTGLDEEFTVYFMNVYNEEKDLSAVTADVYSRVIPQRQKLYRHDINIVSSTSGADIYFTLYTSNMQPLDSAAKILSALGENVKKAAGGFITDSSVAYSVFAIHVENNNSIWATRLSGNTTADTRISSPTCYDNITTISL